MPSYYFLFSLLLLPALLLFLKAKTISSKRDRFRLPPGPWSLPVIGSIHHLIGRGLPHRALHSLSQKYGHLMFLQLGEIPMVVASSREAAREILKTHDLKFCNRPVNNALKIICYGGKDIFFSPYGEYWRQMRKICAMELFTAKRVQSFRSIREEEVKNLIQLIASFSSASKFLNLSDRLFILANNMTVRAIMGSTHKDQDIFLGVIFKALELGAGLNISNLFPSSRLVGILAGTGRRVEELSLSVDRMFENIIRQHREEGDGGAEDLITVLLRLHDEDSDNDRLSMESVKAILFDMITGGTETSGVTSVWAMAELMKNPRVMKKAQFELRQKFEGRESITESDLIELDYIHLIIKETLRMHPPAPLLGPRECRETCNILGYDISMGTTVLVNGWALGRDSNYWKDAEEFKPERFAGVNNDVYSNGRDFSYIPFGAGRRICPGILLGLANIELVLANLLYHFDWELPQGTNPDDLDMTETSGLSARRKSPLCLRALPYKY